MAKKIKNKAPVHLGKTMAVGRSLLRLVAKPHIMFLILAVPAIVIFIRIVPAGWGLDEQVHAARAYQISEGNFYPEVLSGVHRYGGTTPVSLVELLGYGHTASNSVDRSASYFSRRDLPDKSHEKQLEDAPLQNTKQVEYEFGATGAYSPVVYLPSAFGMFVARHIHTSVGTLFTWSKAVQALVYVICAFSALYLLRAYKMKWLVFLVAMLPSSIYQASTINADAYTIGISLFFAAVVYRAYAQPEKLNRKDIFIGFIATALLTFAKPSYGLFALALAFVPARRFDSLAKRLVVLCSLGVLFVGFSLFNALEAMPYASANMLYRDPVTAAHISLGGQVKWLAVHPVRAVVVLTNSLFMNGNEWTQSLVGSLGFNSVNTPYIFILAIQFALGLAAFYEDRLSKRHAVILLSVGFLSAVSVVVLLYASFNPVGDPHILGVQGRYFIPCLMFLLPGIARVLPIKVVMSRMAAWALFSGLSFVTLYITLFEYVKVMS